MKKPTPGPWRSDPKAPEESFWEDVNILRQDGLAVAVAVHNGNIEPDEVEANACLIAAAPDLLDSAKALSEVAAVIVVAGLTDGEAAALRRAFADLDAAIAKAEGRS